ncbi:MAG: hypothetical protein ACK4PR_01680, partial [Gammaproteobacteria bacterium]
MPQTIQEILDNLLTNLKNQPGSPPRQSQLGYSTQLKTHLISFVEALLEVDYTKVDTITQQLAKICKKKNISLVNIRTNIDPIYGQGIPQILYKNASSTFIANEFSYQITQSLLTAIKELKALSATDSTAKAILEKFYIDFHDAEQRMQRRVRRYEYNKTLDKDNKNGLARELLTSVNRAYLDIDKLLESNLDSCIEKAITLANQVLTSDLPVAITHFIADENTNGTPDLLRTEIKKDSLNKVSEIIKQINTEIQNQHYLTSIKYLEKDKRRDNYNKFTELAKRIELELNISPINLKQIGPIIDTLLQTVKRHANKRVPTTVISKVFADKTENFMYRMLHRVQSELELAEQFFVSIRLNSKEATANMHEMIIAELKTLCDKVIEIRKEVQNYRDEDGTYPEACDNLDKKTLALCQTALYRASARPIYSLLQDFQYKLTKLQNGVSNTTSTFQNALTEILGFVSKLQETTADIDYLRFWSPGALSSSFMKLKAFADSANHFRQVERSFYAAPIITVDNSAKT